MHWQDWMALASILAILIVAVLEGRQRPEPPAPDYLSSFRIDIKP